MAAHIELGLRLTYLRWLLKNTQKLTAIIDYIEQLTQDTGWAEKAEVLTGLIELLAEVISQFPQSITAMPEDPIVAQQLYTDEILVLKTEAEKQGMDWSRIIIFLPDLIRIVDLIRQLFGRQM